MSARLVRFHFDLRHRLDGGTQFPMVSSWCESTGESFALSKAAWDDARVRGHY